MDSISSRDQYLVAGLLAAGASRYYFKKRALWPWRVRGAVHEVY